MCNHINIIVVIVIIVISVISVIIMTMLMIVIITIFFFQPRQTQFSCLQPVLSRTSSFVVPMAFMSRSLEQSIHLRFGLPLLLLPCDTISSIFLSTNSLARLFTRPNHPSLASLHLSVMFSTFRPYVLYRGVIISHMVS